MRMQEIRRGHQRRRRVVQIADAILEDVLGQELRLADLAMHGAAGACRESSIVDQLERGVKLIGEILRPPAVIGERRHGGERMLIAMHRAETRFHAPNRQERARRHAIAALDRGEEGGLRMFELAPARDDGRGAALRHEGFQREMKTLLAAIRADRRGIVMGVHESVDARGADAPARFLGKRLFPRLEAARAIAASRRLGRRRSAERSDNKRRRQKFCGGAACR